MPANLPTMITLRQTLARAAWKAPACTPRTGMDGMLPPPSIGWSLDRLCRLRGNAVSPPHQGNGNAEASDHKPLFTKCAWSLNCSLWETGTGLFYLDFVFVGGFGLRNNTRFSEGRFLIVHPYSSASAQALVRASSSGSPGEKISS